MELTGQILPKPATHPNKFGFLESKPISDRFSTQNRPLAIKSDWVGRIDGWVEFLHNPLFGAQLSFKNRFCNRMILYLNNLL